MSSVSTSGVTAVAAGGLSTCAITSGGGLKCWGDDVHAELGNDSLKDSRTPIDVPGLTSGVVAVDIGGRHTCALTSGGGVLCWGDNEYGQIGNGTNTVERTEPMDSAFGGSPPVVVKKL